MCCIFTLSVTHSLCTTHPQVVTHLCYSDFEDIMGPIDRMDGGWRTMLHVAAVLSPPFRQGLATRHEGRATWPLMSPCCMPGAMMHACLLPLVRSLCCSSRASSPAGLLKWKNRINPVCMLTRFVNLGYSPTPRACS
jgi:hypothetical protein